MKTATVFEKKFKTGRKELGSTASLFLPKKERLVALNYEIFER